MIIIVLPNFIPKSLNVLFAMNHWKRAAYKKEVSELVGWLCKGQTIEPIVGPIDIHFTFQFKAKRNRDMDNFIGGAKFIIDGLKDAGIIPDDNSDIVKSITVQFKKGSKEQTIIKLKL